jgi:hypothetical protein
MTSVANNAIYINQQLISHAETASRPLHLNFMSEQDMFGIYTITKKTITRFILGNELLAVLILSGFIALMLTMFGIWIQSTVMYQLYQRSKLVVAGNIARERHKKRIPNDTVTEVRLAEVQYNICFDLDYFSYVQLGTCNVVMLLQLASDIALLNTLVFLTLICRSIFDLLLGTLFFLLELHRILAHDRKKKKLETQEGSGFKMADRRTELLNAAKKIAYLLRESLVCSIGEYILFQYIYHHYC